MSNHNLFLPITKATKEADGTLRVFGKATGPDLDIDGQIADPKWLKQAMPAWMEWGNIREQHSSIAAGVGLTLEQSGDDWNLESLVVDPGSVKKVDAGVLKGYSIGIRNAKVVKDAMAPHGRIVGGQIVEVSLVDRPANPTCTLALAKSAGSGEPLELVKADAMDMTNMTDKVGEDESYMNDAAETNAITAEMEADEANEPNLVQKARTALGELLVDEATELANGIGGTGPVQILLCLLDDLAWFECCDEADDANAIANMMRSAIATPTAPPEGTMNLSTVASLVKNATADNATEEDRDAVAELRKAFGLDDMTEAIATATLAVEQATASATDALTKATAAEDTLTGVAADVAKVKEMAAPGGPVRTRLDADVAKATNTERASHYASLANSVTDPTLKKGYAALAAEARKD